jgi:hypothetical protein
MGAEVGVCPAAGADGGVAGVAEEGVSWADTGAREPVHDSKTADAIRRRLRFDFMQGSGY